MLRNIFCEFALATVKFFGWTMGITLAFQFWNNPAQTIFTLQWVIRTLMLASIIGLMLLVLLGQLVKKEQKVEAEAIE